MFTKSKLREIEILMLDGVEASGWYDDAHNDIQGFAKYTQQCATMVADVVAILSPRVQVSRNCKLALEWLETGKASGAMGQRLDALELYVQNGVVSGPKVSCFAENLKGNFDEITVDVWIAKAFGVAFDTITDTQREAIKEVIRELAAYHGMTPASVQACIWVGKRKAEGLTDSEGALLLSHHIDLEAELC